MGKHISYFCDACHTEIEATNVLELGKEPIKSEVRPQRIGKAELCDGCYHAVQAMIRAGVVFQTPEPPPRDRSGTAGNITKEYNLV